VISGAGEVNLTESSEFLPVQRMVSVPNSSIKTKHKDKEGNTFLTMLNAS